MAVNLIVLAVTLLMASFLVIWIAVPAIRPWIESPKYRILDWDKNPSPSHSTTDPER